MMIGGMDVSGDVGSGNHKFMSIVLGTETSIQSITKGLRFEQIHMSEIIDKEKKNNIVSRLEFNGIENTAFCIRIDKNRIINSIMGVRRMKKRNTSISRISRTFNYLLLKYIRENITDFLSRNNHSLLDVVFQCDADCRIFAKDNGLKYDVGKEAYVLADIVAWANNHNMEPQGVIPLDFRKTIEGKLKTLF